MGCNAGTNITKNERTGNVSRIFKGTLGATPSLGKNHRIESILGLKAINSLKVGDGEVEAKIHAINGDERTENK